MNKIRRIPTCNRCGKHFKTNQGVGGHLVLYHRSDITKEGEQNSALSLDTRQLETFLNRVTSLETEVKDLHSKMTSWDSVPFGLWGLVVCLKCGLVLEMDKIFREGNWFEDDDAKKTKSIASIKPKPPFIPVFKVAVLSKESTIQLYQQTRQFSELAMGRVSGGGGGGLNSPSMRRLPEATTGLVNSSILPG